MASIAIDEEIKTASIAIDGDEVGNDQAQGIGATVALNQITQGVGAEEAFSQIPFVKDYEASKASWMDQVQGSRLSEIEAGMDVNQPDKTIEQITTLSNNTIGLFGEDGQAEESVKSIPETIDLDENERGQLELDTLVRHTLTKYATEFSEEGTFDSVNSFLGTFIPERESVLLKQVLDELGFENSFLDTVGIDTDEIRKFRNLYDGLNIKNKARLIKATASAVDKHGDNPIINGSLLSVLFAPTFEGEESRTFFNLLDATVVLEIGALAKVGIQSVNTSAKIINTAKRLKASPAAAVKIVKEAISNPEAAIKAGITPADVMDAQDITMPSTARELLTGADETMAGEITSMMNSQQKIVEDLLTTTRRDGVLTKEEQTEVIKQTQIRLAEDEDIASGTVKITQIDAASYRVEYTRTKRDSLGRRRGEEDVDEVAFFSVNDQSPLLQVEEEFTNGILAFDPNARSTGQFKDLFVTTIERIGPQQSRVKAGLDSVMKEAFKDLEGNFLTGKNIKPVNDVLLLGDDVGEVFTFEQLITGVGNNVRFKPLTPQQAKSYLGVRNMMDIMFDIENARFVENLNIRGVKLADLPQGSVPVKSFNTPEEALTEFWNTADPTGSPHIAIMGAGLKKTAGEERIMQLKNYGDLDEDFLRGAYANNYRLTKVDNESNLFQREGTRTQWALVKENKVLSPTGKKVLNRKRGYIPKERTDSFFFIKEEKSTGLSGNKKHLVLSTVSYSDNLADAQAELAKLGDGYKILRDREMSPEQAMYDTQNVQGGMYSGARKSDPIPFVGGGTGKRKDTMESIQGYINHIGKQYPINLFRMGIEKRALDTARQLGLEDARNIEDLITKGQSKKFSAKTQAIFKDMHDQVAFLRNIPTNAEIKMSNTLQSIGERLEASSLSKIPGFNKIPKVLYGIAGRGTQPQDYMRGVSFNTLLGMYNPAQLLVQASGMLVSFAINPVHFTRSIPRAVGYHNLDLIDDLATRTKMIKWMKSNGLGDYQEGYEIWRRSGLVDNITNSNADYTSVFTKQLPYDSGVLRKFLSGHTWFYKQGELANTRMAYSTAYQWYKKNNNIKGEISPDNVEAVNAILKRTEINRLNMSKANQSDLNKGLKSVPLQFQQVISKYYEKILPQMVGGTDELTALEKMRLFGIVSTATGAAGVPLAESVYLHFLDMAGVNPAEISPETTQAFKYGALGYMLKEGFDLNADITSRMTLGIDAYELVAESLFQSHDLFQLLGGPTHGVSKRAVKQMQFMSKAFNVYGDVEEDTTSYEDLTVMASIFMEASSDFITVTKNMKAYTAYLFGDNPAFYRDGQYLLDFRSMNEQTAFFGILGFNPQEISELYEIKNTLRREQGGAGGKAQFLEEEAKIMLRIINSTVLSDRNDNRSILGGKVVNAMLRNRPAREQLALLDRMRDLALNKKLDHDNLFFKYIMEISDGIEHGFGIINVEMSKASEARK